MINADYGDDLALLANSPSQAECLLHSLEPTGNVLVSTGKQIKRRFFSNSTPHALFLFFECLVR